VIVSGEGMSYRSPQLMPNSHARTIVRACVRGQAEVVLSIPAKVAVKFNGLFPSVSSSLMALANRFLPSASGSPQEKEAKPRKQSYSRVSPSWVTTLGTTARVLQSWHSHPAKTATHEAYPSS